MTASFRRCEYYQKQICLQAFFVFLFETDKMVTKFDVIDKVCCMNERQMIVQAEKLVNPLLFEIDMKTLNFLQGLIRAYAKSHSLSPRQKTALMDILYKHDMLNGNAGKRKELLG